MPNPETSCGWVPLMLASAPMVPRSTSGTSPQHDGGHRLGLFGLATATPDERRRHRGRSQDQGQRSDQPSGRRPVPHRDLHEVGPCRIPAPPRSPAPPRPPATPVATAVGPITSVAYTQATGYADAVLRASHGIRIDASVNHQGVGGRGGGGGGMRGGVPGQSVRSRGISQQPLELRDDLPDRDGGVAPNSLSVTVDNLSGANPQATGLSTAKIREIHQMLWVVDERWRKNLPSLSTCDSWS